jgi:hypothetical protein
VTFLAHAAIAVANFILGFYGFWLVWRILLPLLPGPRDADERIAPYATYFTEPFVGPVARALRLPPRVVAVVALLALGAAAAGLGRAGDAL